MKKKNFSPLSGRRGSGLKLGICAKISGGRAGFLPNLVEIYRDLCYTGCGKQNGGRTFPRTEKEVFH